MALAAANLRTVGGNIWGNYDLNPSGKVWSPQGFIDGARYRCLDRQQQYFQCKQHDGKRFDFDGRVLMAGTTELSFTQPMLSSEKAAFFVPLRARRPSCPYRLAKAIVNAFTSFVFGEGRFPAINVPGDEDSQDFIGACAQVGHLPIKMVEARNLGGAVGTVGLSWSFVEGKPKFSAHNGKQLFVQKWEDRDELIPAHVTKAFLYTEEEWDPETRKVVDVAYWYRRDWTKDAEIVFHPVRYKKDEDPNWEAALDLEKSVKHDDGDPHFVWIQNQPNSEGIDGSPDCEGQFEALDELDIIVSVITRGAKLNLDPTLVIKADQLYVQRFGVKKGSDNALVVDRDGGDAKYLELAGQSLEAGIKVANEQRRFILEATECVIPDPDQIAAQGQSSAAQKMVFSRMLSKGGIIQEQYGTAMERLCEPLLWIAQKRVQVPAQVIDPENPEQLVDVPQTFNLPPRVDQIPEMGDDGQPTGKHNPQLSERDPGTGSDVELQWPPRFPPTPQDMQAIVTTATTAVPNKAVLSQQTAVEVVSAALGKDASEEWKRVQSDSKQDDQKQQQMMQDSQDGAGGKVPHAGAMPPGAHPGGGAKPSGGGGKSGSSGDEGDDAQGSAEPPAD